METKSEITYDLTKEIIAMIRTGTTITFTPVKTDYGIIFTDIDLKIPPGTFFGDHPIHGRHYLSTPEEIAKTLHEIRIKFLIPKNPSNPL